MNKFTNRYIIFEIAWIVCIFANIIYTHTTIMHLNKWHHVIYPTSHICFLLFEGFSFYFLSFIYPKRRNIILLLLFYIITIILWINVGYSRYFDTYMPLSLYVEFNNLNGLLPNIKDAIEKSDLFFLVTSIIISLVYYKLGNKPKPQKWYILPSVFASLLFFTFIRHYNSIKSEHDHLVEHFKELNDQRSVWDTMCERRQMMENNMPKESSNYYGIGLTLFLNIIDQFYNTQKTIITEEETIEIKKHTYPSDYSIPNDTTKNLILILVESLSTYPINKYFKGIELTPNINRLIKESYFNSNMASEAILGESSDGQFIYLTGLLPLKRGVTINEIKAQHITTFIAIAHQQIPSLYSQMTIPTDKNAWSQESMCQKYGINTLFSKEQYSHRIEDEWLNDKQLFEFATETDKNLKPPFISLVLTSSMHSPYYKSYEEFQIDYPAYFSTELKHYLDNVHYMDKYLGYYLLSLQKYPWYKECTIIITADHKPNGPKLNAYNKDLFTTLPLIIIHPPHEYEGKMNDKPIYQTSLFPSIIDMLHLDSEWKGVGISLFAPEDIKNNTYERERKSLKEKTSNYIIHKELMTSDKQ